MTAYIMPIFLGVVCIIIGISNMRGNISSLHSYHTKRVSDEDRVPFGKTVGLGTIICGAGIIVFGIFNTIAHYTQISTFTLIGSISLAVALIPGIALILYAMFKYNKGIF